MKRNIIDFEINFFYLYFLYCEIVSVFYECNILIFFGCIILLSLLKDVFFFIDYSKDIR